MLRCRVGPIVATTAFVVAASLPPLGARAESADVERILSGVATPALPAGCTALASFGEGSFPVVAAGLDGTRAPIVAAARWRAGRAVVFSDRGLALGETGRRLLRNAATWCAGENHRPTITVVGGVVAPDLLSGIGATVVSWSVQELRLRMEAPDFDIAVVDADIVRGPDGRRVGEFLTAFVKGGGGVVFVGDSGARDRAGGVESPLGPYEPNRMVAPMGIAWSRRPVDSTVPVEATSPNQPADADARLALKRLWERSSGKSISDEEVVAATTRVVHALLAAPLEEGWFTSKAVQYVTKYAQEVPLPWGPGQAAEKIRAVLNWRGVSLAGSRATTPTRSAYPFAIPAGAPTGVHTVRIPAGFTGLLTTDLAARPGVPVVVTAPGVPPGTTALRFGIHAPLRWEAPRWDRFPELRARVPLSKDFTGAIPFGGPIAVEVSTALSTPIDLRFQEVDRFGAEGVEGTAVPGWTRIETAVGMWWLPPGADRLRDRPLLEGIGDAVRAARADLDRPVTGGESWTFDPAAAVGNGILGVPPPGPEDPLEVGDVVGAATATAAGRAPDGWLARVSGVAVSPRIPPPDAPARQLARARAGGPALPETLARRELVQQIRDGFGAPTLRAAVVAHVRAGAPDTADSWVRTLSIAVGRDLRPHFAAFHALPTPGDDDRLGALPPWNGLAVDRVAPPAPLPGP
ncbi:MAG: hypothetical protein ACKO5K_04910 [Armatimonadota bacterium]